MLLNASLALILLITKPCGTCCPRVQKSRDSLKNHLFWRGSIRVFIETFADLTLFTMLNVSEAEWPKGLESVITSNVISYLTLLACLAVPAFLFFYACRRRATWQDPDFQDRFGSLLDGSRQDTDEAKVTALLVMVAFYVRRLSLSLTLVYI